MSLKETARLKIYSLYACLLVLPLFISLSGCRADHVSVNKADPHSPQYAYRLDELAMLEMMADDIQNLEKKKRYGEIYDHYGSTSMKQSIDRRRFLMMSNCVENTLGALEEFDPNDLGFRRLRVVNPGQKDHHPLADASVDVLDRKVVRAINTMTEHLAFVPDNLTFKLKELSWLSDDKPFHECLTRPDPVLAAPPGATSPSTTSTTVAAPTPGNSPEAGAMPAPTASTPAPGSVVTPPTVTTPVPVAPVITAPVATPSKAPQTKPLPLGSAPPATSPERFHINTAPLSGSGSGGAASQQNSDAR